MSVLPASGVISLARGIPAPDLLPLERLAEGARRAIERHGRVALNYGPPQGFGPLCEWIADRHGVAPERVVVTPGSLIGMGFLVRALVEPGARVLVEAPTYDRMLHLLREARAEIVPDPFAGPARLVYLMPTFHNPTGRSATLEQRERLAAAAIEHGLTVVEDDPYGLVRLDGEPLPSVCDLLRARGADELAVFMSSFSKSVAPGLRVGYLVLPERLVAPVRALATATYVSPPLLPQAQLLEFLAAGELEPHLEHVRRRLRPRRDAMLEALDAAMPAGADWTRPEGGYFLWLELPGDDVAELLPRARAAGVDFVPGSGFGGGAGSARLAFSYATADEIRTGVARLGALTARTSPPSTRRPDPSAPRTPG
jgi:2-aminoadipate transaminase